MRRNVQKLKEVFESYGWWETECAASSHIKFAALGNDGHDKDIIIRKSEDAGPFSLQIMAAWVESKNMDFYFRGSYTMDGKVDELFDIAAALRKAGC